MTEFRFRIRRGAEADAEDDIVLGACFGGRVSWWWTKIPSWISQSRKPIGGRKPRGSWARWKISSLCPRIEAAVCYQRIRGRSSRPIMIRRLLGKDSLGGSLRSTLAGCGEDCRRFCVPREYTHRARVAGISLRRGTAIPSIL